MIVALAALAFMVGIADPGAGAIPSADVSALGLSAERRTVEWRGQPTFGGSIAWTPGLRHFLAVSAGVSPLYVPVTDSERQAYCGFVVSILRLYPNVHDVIVWNEPNLTIYWGMGGEAYADLLVACSSIIRSAGARIWAPGMSPSTTAGIAHFASVIAARGPHLIDGWDQHDYGALPPLRERVAAVRAAFGWRIPILIGESGNAFGDNVASLMAKAFCAAAVGWLNFNLRDDGDWKPTGLERADGSRKASYGSFQREAALIGSGQELCGSQSAPPPPPGQKRSAWIAERLEQTGSWARAAYER